MILQEKSYIHGTRGKPWTLQAGRLARVRAPCRSGGRGEDRCRGISENQQGRTTTTTTTTCHGLLEGVSFFGHFLCLILLLPLFKFLNEAGFWIVVIMRMCCSMLFTGEFCEFYDDPGEGRSAQHWAGEDCMWWQVHIIVVFRFPRRMRSFHGGSAAVATCWAMDGLTCAGRGLCGRCGLGARWQKVLFLHMIYSIQT